MIPPLELLGRQLMTLQHLLPLMIRERDDLRASEDGIEKIVQIGILTIIVFFK